MGSSSPPDPFLPIVKREKVVDGAPPPRQMSMHGPRSTVHDRQFLESVLVFERSLPLVLVDAGFFRVFLGVGSFGLDLICLFSVLF